MSSASANSSKTSKKEVENNLNESTFCVSGGLYHIDDKENKLVIEPAETINDYCKMFEIEKTVGSHTKTVNKNGNEVRIDAKTGTKYIKGKDGKINIVRRSRTDRASR